MLLTPDQIDKISEILNHRVSVFIGKSYGAEYLSTQQKEQLQRMGINLESMYKLHTDPMFLQYQLGMMSQILTKLELNRYSFPEFLDSIRRGEYIQLSPREKATLNAVKLQSLSDIRSYQGHIFTDLNNVVNKNTTDYLTEQRKTIQRELKAGLAKRKSFRAIAQDLGNLTGDWARNWNRIVQFQGHKAFDEGRAAVIERKSGEDAEVYKITYEGACKHCIRLYRTEGQDSEPIVFKLSDLQANGTNIGLKTADWKPVVGATHPFCRCPLFHKEKGQVWDKELKQFVYPKDKPLEPSMKRSKVPMKIGEKEYMV